MEFSSPLSLDQVHKKGDVEVNAVSPQVARMMGDFVPLKDFDQAGGKEWNILQIALIYWLPPCNSSSVN